ncbi:MAG: penicillin-binding protein [Caulobacteraceae bacterium]|nr:penicillin-binding protein [Caulobacteraceae bacterium]
MIAIIAAATVLLQALSLPSLPNLPAITREPQITYLDRTGAVIGIRGGRFAPPVDLAKLPAYVPAAFVAIEDRRFYDHEGFDPVGMARALVADLSQGKREGASTITQQLARNLFLSPEQTAERKAKELVYAVQLEQKYSKKQILGLYLSRVYFGAGAYGIEAAAQRYFNKPAARLTIREAAMLAALMKSPTNYNPADQPKASADRTALVLAAMQETGAITAAQKAQALKEAPKVWKTAPQEGAGYFIDWIDAQARATIGANKQDMVVETTLDLATEQSALDAAKQAGVRVKSAQAAVVAIDGDGRMRAMVGGSNYASAPDNRAVSARRQAGSAWKPFVYLTALEAGLTPDSPVVDAPITLNGWTPTNYEPGYAGQVTLEQAMARSLNTVAVRLADQYGRPAVAATAQRLGVTSTINTDPAMALGTSLIAPIELARAYAAFANGGQAVRAYGIEKIHTVSGQSLYQAPPPVLTQAIQNPALNELQRMMRTVVASGTGTRAAIPGQDIAGKTGTTSDYKDAWFAGYTGNLALVVWMGRDDNAPMGTVTGGTVPAELWKGVMSTAVARLPVTPIPPGPPAPPPPPPPPSNPLDALLNRLFQSQPASAPASK